MKSFKWGGFNYQDVYSQMVKRFDNAVFVEIGAWEGESTIFMAEEIRESGKNIKFYTIDTFSPYSDVFSKEGDVNVANYGLYLENIDHVKSYITTLIGDSVMYAGSFADKSIDFLFIDGNHENIREDIIAWLPKVKYVIAGHDYSDLYPGVKKIVDEIFPNRCINHESWINEL